GGPAGALLANYLGKGGYEVDVYEMRDDLRTAEIGRGKSINLALSYRGLSAMKPVGLTEEVMRLAVPMRGRMIHSVKGDIAFQSYGVEDSQAINSVSRSGLNVAILNAAAQYPSVRLHFNAKCNDIRLDSGEVTIVDTRSGAVSNMRGDIVASADGAFSTVRRTMQKMDRFNYSQTYLEHGYKELTIPPVRNGEFALNKNALHIWPRRSFMMIALPNSDGSFTCTLFWPFEGRNSFAAIRTESDLHGLFEKQFPDALGMMPTLAEDYFANPVGSMVTLRCSPWHVGDRVVLLGDACHAVVPFYGQGMNAAFEDVLVLSECMGKHRPDWRRVFEAYEECRKPNTDALADLAVANFIEMRDHTGSRLFLLRKKWEKLLGKLFPWWYIPLYTLVTFTRTPYAEAVVKARRQNRIVLTTVGVILGLVILVLWRYLL
ncbi:MAG: NAD(P)/FAD-dependent oxidoreductase, partial [Planctomycetota bacterium]